MFTVKRFIFVLTAVVLAVSSVSAQNKSSNDMTIEESYLMDALENMIIRESSRVDSRTSKLIALGYINDAIERGNTSEDVKQALEFLSLEGTRSQARENGRLVNNYPDVRTRSATLLGKLGTEEAKDVLLEICKNEKEPMVLYETIKSLGDIGINDNNKTIDSIVWVVSRFDNLNPDNRLAVATMDALEKFAKNTGSLPPDAIRLILKFSEGLYISPVKERARQFLAELRSYSSKKN